MRGPRPRRTPRRARASASPRNRRRRDRRARRFSSRRRIRAQMLHEIARRPVTTPWRMDLSGFPSSISRRRSRHRPSSGATTTTLFRDASRRRNGAVANDARSSQIAFPETSSVASDAHRPNPSGSSLRRFEPRYSSASAGRWPIASGTDVMAFSRTSNRVRDAREDIASGNVSSRFRDASRSRRLGNPREIFRKTHEAVTGDVERRARRIARGIAEARRARSRRRRDARGDRSRRETRGATRGWGCSSTIPGEGGDGSAGKGAESVVRRRRRGAERARAASGGSRSGCGPTRGARGRRSRRRRRGGRHVVVEATSATSSRASHHEGAEEGASKLMVSGGGRAGAAAAPASPSVNASGGIAPRLRPRRSRTPLERAASSALSIALALIGAIAARFEGVRPGEDAR